MSRPPAELVDAGEDNHSDSCGETITSWRAGRYVMFLASVAFPVVIGLLAPTRPTERHHQEHAWSIPPGTFGVEEKRATGGPLTKSLSSLLWKLTVVLELTPRVAARIFPILSEFERASQELARERESIVREIQVHLLSSTPDRETLQVLVDCLLANQQLQSRLPEEQFSALRKYLTPVQQARYLLFVRHQR